MEYVKFIPSNVKIHADSEEDMFFIFKGDNLLVKDINKEYFNLGRGEIKANNIVLENLQIIGSYLGRNVYMAEVEEASKYKLVDLREYGNGTSYDYFMIGSKAKILLNHERKNKYCGLCAGKMEKNYSDHDRSLKCSQCGNLVWTSTSPAIIVAVRKGNKLLLAHNKTFPEGMYSVLAGFLEFGESFEECVKREVFEETNIKVENIEYFGSQIWAFPNSLMIGFTADYLEGEIEVDGIEIEDAKWFSPSELKGIYRKSPSISNSLIENFIEKNE